MGIVIDDPQIEAKIRELAERTGETPQAAVAHAVDVRLAELPTRPAEERLDNDLAARRKRIRETLAYFDSLPRINENLTADEIVGYDENGLPT
ncbi:type II toxin-antitoxin system VapB family antitoxin [Rhodoplanes azumiensis]|uniref:Type II toxin-antitoxin system VapB family antitoxin n=1 Tax=Rhodoplanes azumiensis TaxID=1897628 RepID=A0ABW5AGN5_9BRAD